MLEYFVSNEIIQNLQFHVDHPVCGGKNNYCNKIADEMMMRKKVRGTA